MKLKGKRILITRPRAQAEEFAQMLISEGAEPIFFPVIRIIPPADFSTLDDALHHLNQYYWLILTSIHSVDVFFARLQALEIEHLPKYLRIAAVGPKTALRLSGYGCTPNFVPAEYTANAILPGLGDVAGKHFLLPQSDIGLHVLADAIRAKGGIPDEIVVYRNVPTKPNISAVNALCSGVEVITFVSPSSVKGFISALGKYNLDVHALPANPLVACIGPRTASAARAANLCVHVEAREHTMTGLINALKSV